MRQPYSITDGDTNMEVGGLWLSRWASESQPQCGVINFSVAVSGYPHRSDPNIAAGQQVGSHLIGAEL